MKKRKSVTKGSSIKRIQGDQTKRRKNKYVGKYIKKEEKPKKTKEKCTENIRKNV